MECAQQIPMKLSGSALRDLGKKQAIDHAEIVSPGWTDRTIDALIIFCKELCFKGTPEFTIEDFRATRKDDLPASPNSWGSIPAIAIRRGIIRWTGKYTNAKSLKTHAHPVRVYSITLEIKHEDQN